MRRARLAGFVLGLLPPLACGATEVTRPAPASPSVAACGVTGGFLLPGTDGCLRIGGDVRAEGGWTLAAPVAVLAPSDRAGPARRRAVADTLSGSSLGTEARLSADVRIPTDLGPVRVYVSVRDRNGRTTDHAAR